jgi:hypothetical protein
MDIQKMEFSAAPCGGGLTVWQFGRELLTYGLPQYITAEIAGNLCVALNLYL